MFRNNEKSCYILVGADPESTKLDHPGGQATASYGLIKYVREELNSELIVIDTTQSVFPFPSMSARVLSALKRLRQLAYVLLRRNVAGVIIFSSGGFSFYEKSLMSLLCRLFNTKDILFIRSGFFRHMVISSRTKSNIAKWLLKIPYCVGGQGESWRDLYEFLGVPSSKITIIPNWLNPEDKLTPRKTIGEPISMIRFIFIGWLVNAKGVNQLVDATIELSRNWQFELLLVGGGTLEEPLRRKLKTVSDEVRIKLLGWQRREQVNELLRDSHVFVLPSEAEGFPNALVEAMATGLACIATDVGGISDSLANNYNGFLLDNNRVDTIVKAMQNYLESPELIDTHSKYSLQVANERHDWLTNCQKLFMNFE